MASSIGSGVPSTVSEPAPEPRREGPPPGPGSSPDASSVSRSAWISGWVAGIGVAGLGLGGLSFFEPGKVLKVVLEMAVMALALWITTRIWSRSAEAHAGGLDSPPGPADRKGLESDRHDA